MGHGSNDFLEHHRPGAGGATRIVRGTRGEGVDRAPRASAREWKELWAVASYIQGGCSDDSFDYFRGWLVAQGEAVFLAAMNDPASLVEHHWPGDDETWPGMSCEDMLSVGRRAYERATGAEMSWDLELPTIEERTRWPADRVKTYDWTDADVLKLFPRLEARWKVPR